jgi:hypothetical protein
VFVTSSGRDGDFGLDDPAGPLAFADAECNRLAGDAGLPGTYKAWLSDDTASPSTRFTTASVPYVRVDGVRIADDWTDLTTCDASGTVCLDNRINLTEKSEAAPQWAWTGTTTDGNSSPDSCNEWTLTQSRGIVGDTSRINYFWTGALLGVGQVSGGRGSIRSFLCFQQ